MKSTHLKINHRLLIIVVHRWYATTQMESVYARWALPCFDEPDLKATFKFVIEHRSHMVALTNSIEEGPVEDLGDGWVRTSYKWTPLMPTYLLAFAVGEFDYLERNTSNGCRVSEIIILFLYYICSIIIYFFIFICMQATSLLLT